MFEVNMDEYLEEEVEYVKQALEGICRTWDQQVGGTNDTVAAISDCIARRFRRLETGSG